MKIAVVTPVFGTPAAWLHQCLESVRGQTLPATHFLVNDGDLTIAREDYVGVEYFSLPGPHLDNGNAARSVGSISAIIRGFDAIAYLDADNWYEPDHLQELVQKHQETGASVCTAARQIVDLEGHYLGPCPETDGEKLVDTSSFFLTRKAFGLVAIWYQMPRKLSPICDRVVWKAVHDRALSRAHSSKATVNFRTNYASHYTYFRKPVPVGAKHLSIALTKTGEFASVKVLTAGLNTYKKPPSTPATSRTRTVSLCMIVKNEEANLAACLRPVAGLFDEVIVVDTGSADETKECARRHGAKVFDFEWVDSFAAARNESLRHATGEWIFWLDGDDRLDDANLQKLQQLLATLSDANNVYMMCQRSAPDQLTGSCLVVDQARLFRNLPQARWTYRVHEQIFVGLKELGAKEVRTGVTIDHLGYQEPEMRRRKRERNVRLLHMDLVDKPNDGFVHFNLANALIDAGQMDDSIELLLKTIAFAPKGASYLPKTYFLVAGACQVLGRGDAALRHCREGKKHFPKAADLWFQEGVLLLAKEDLQGACHAFETILKLPSRANYVGVDPDLATSRTRHNLAFIYRRLGRRREAEEQWSWVLQHAPHFEPAWLALMELCLEQKRTRDAQAILGRLADHPNKATIEPALQARLCLARKDVAGARKILEEALKASPRTLWLRILLADILIRVGNDAKAAEEHLRAVLALSPNEQQARQKLASLLEGNREIHVLLK